MRFATHLALGLVVGSVGLIAAASGPQTPTAGAVVAGQVVDASTGQGVAGAVVTLGTGAPPAVSSEGFQAPVPAASRRAVAIANADGDGNYVVEWRPAVLALRYTLEQADEPSFDLAKRVYGGPATSFTVQAITPGRYYYRVRGGNALGVGPWSDVVAVDVFVP